MLFSFLFPLIMGSVTDVVAPMLTPGIVPQLGLIYILVPMIVIMYSIRHFGILRRVTPVDFTPDGLILDEVRHKRIYFHAGNIIVGGSMIHFMHRYFFVNAPLYSELYYSGILFAAGIFVFSLHSLRIKQSTMDNILSVVIMLIIPYLSFAYQDSAAVTVWAIPFFFVIISIMFKNKLSLILINLTIIASQIYIWVTVPVMTTEITGIDHFLRIVFYLVSLGLVSFINFIYVNRLKETELQINFQRMLFDLSSNFLTITEADADEKIYYTLQKTANYLQFDQAYICMLSSNQQSFIFTHVYSSDPQRELRLKGKALLSSQFEASIEELMKNRPIYYDRPENIAPEKSEEKMYFGERKRSGFSRLRNIVPGYILEKTPPQRL